MAAEVYNLTNLVELLKEQYTDETVAVMGYTDNPLLGMVEKDESLGGEYFVVPIVYGHARYSSSFSTAVSQRGRARAKQFQVTTADSYSVAEINRKFKLAARGGDTSFLSGVKTAVDDAIYTITRSLAIALYGKKAGTLGKVSAIASDTITLVEVNDIVNFEVGQRVTGFTAETGGTEHDTKEIIAIDPDLGKITLDAIGTIAVNDFLFNEGDRGNRIAGLQEWLPATAPAVGGGDSHFGVDRSADPVRLAGTRVDISGLPIEEGLQKLATRVGRYAGKGVKPNVILLNDFRWTELALALGSKAIYDKVASTQADIGYDAIMVHWRGGKIAVIGDSNCPYNRAFCLTMSTWKLRSISKAPHIFDLDTPQELLRYASADAYELRVGYYAQLVCNRPGANGVGTF